MNVKLIRAMQRCCSTKQGEVLAQPTLINGELCATDRVVAVRYREPSFSEDKMPNVPWQLFEHEVKGIEGTAKVRIDAKGFHVKGMQSHGYPASKYPDLPAMWLDLLKNPDDWQLDFDPKQVRKALAVFEATGANVEFIHRGNCLDMQGWNHRTKAMVNALVMGCRR